MTKYRLLLCVLTIFLICGCSNDSDSETESGYRSLSDLLATERSTEGSTKEDSSTESSSAEETSSANDNTYVMVVPSQKPTEGIEDVTTAARETSSETQTDTPSKAAETPEKVIIYQYVEVPVLPNDYFFSENFSHCDNTLVFSPREIYYHNGTLHATMYIYNGHGTTATDIRDIYLSFDNGTTAIATAKFDRLNGCSIAPNCYVLWDFTFPAEAVYLNNTNLHNINTTYESTYNY